MPVSYRQFIDDLHDEHVEEAAFLYEFVLGTRRDDEFSWTAAQDFEQRREAHVDALLIGGDAALARCTAALDDGPGALHTCAAVLARSSGPESLYEYLEPLESLHSGLEPDDTEGAEDVVAAAMALRDALVEHAPDAALAALADAASAGTPTLALLGVALAVEQRALAGGHEALYGTLRMRADTAIATNGAAGDGWTGAVPFGLLAAARFRDHHLAGLDAASPTLRHACIEHVQSGGSPRDLERLRTLARPGEGNHAALVSVAGASFATTLRAAARSGLDADLLLALGLLGTPDVVALLLPALESELAGSAAIALHALTGAVLEEEVFEEEAVDETTLFDDEIEAWRQGEAPTRTDGSPWGENRMQLSTDPVRWRAWLDEHASEFVSGTRYRQGRPVSPEALLFALRRDHTPHAVRRFSAMELRMRHDPGTSFDVTLPVALQIHHLGELRRSIGRATPSPH